MTRRLVAVRRLFSVLTILSFTFTQAFPAWASAELTRSALRTEQSPKVRAGLEESLGLNLQKIPTSVFDLPVGQIPLVSVRLRPLSQAESQVVSTPSEPTLNTDSLASLADQGGWFWISGLTLPGKGAVVFDRPYNFHWPIIQFLTRSPEAQTRRWMSASLSELAAGIRDGQHTAVAAAIIQHGAFCATRGEAPSLMPNYDVNEPPISVQNMAGIVEILENSGVNDILRSRRPVYLLENIDSSVQLEGPSSSPKGGRVSFQRVVAGRTELRAIDLNSEEAVMVSEFLQEWRIHARQKPSPKQEQELRQWHSHRLQLEGQRRELFNKLIREKLEPNSDFRNTLFDPYAGGRQSVDQFLALSWEFKRFSQFAHTFRSPARRSQIQDLVDRLDELIKWEEEAMAARHDVISSLVDQEIVRSTLVKLKDLAWNLRNDVLENVRRVEELSDTARQFTTLSQALSPDALRYFWALILLFNGINYRLEARGRDSLGISVMTTFPDKGAFDAYLTQLGLKGAAEFEQRTQIRDLADKTILVSFNYQENQSIDPKKPVTVTFVYKVAEVVGELGDNVMKIQEKMIADGAFQTAARLPLQNFSAIIHTRWASAGIVRIENTHPHDNSGVYKDLLPGNVEIEYGFIELGGRAVQTIATLRGFAPAYGKPVRIMAIENGDVENYKKQILTREEFYPDLLAEYRKWPGPWSSRDISRPITTDAKMIPLRIEHYLGLGYTVQEAIQRAVRDFRGSFAIQIVCDAEPGKIYLATNGKGQSLYVGISPDGFHPASEDYGFVDLTQEYIQVKPGEIVLIDQDLSPKLENLKVCTFDGKPVPLTPKDVRRTTKTTRDVYLPTDRYRRYFSKEISEAAQMFNDTTFGKIGIRHVPGDGGREFPVVNLSEEEFPEEVAQELQQGRYRRIIFTGMGTAHAAALVMAQTLRDYLSKSQTSVPVKVEAMLAPELQGFHLEEEMFDTLVVIVTQSGKTADTNQAMNAAIQRGARPMGIINARESDAAFDIANAGGGVIFTGTGRDIEIAVASTKAYYAQIAAGVIYAMKIAKALGVPDEFFLEDVKELLRLPAKMRTFEQSVTQSNGDHPLIQAAEFFPLFVPEWAVVGSGAAEAAAVEAVIKLSELCYRCFFNTSISNLKHVNFSARPWVLVLAANVHGQQDFVQENLSGEMDSMLAHTLAPTVVTTEGDHRFDAWTVQVTDSRGRKENKPVPVIRVPETTERFSPIFLTMASHLLAYYIAENMNKRGQMLMEALADVLRKKSELEAQNKTHSEILANRDFRHLVRERFGPVLSQIREGTFNTGVRPDQAAELVTLIPFLMGDIQLSQAKFYLGEEVPATVLLARFEESVTLLAQRLLRTIDTIAEQAKYVTVGVKASADKFLGDMKQFIGFARGKRLSEQIVLELSHGYRACRATNTPWLEVVPDPESPLDRSLLLVVTQDPGELQVLSEGKGIKQGIVARGLPLVDGGLRDRFSDEQGGLFIGTYLIDRPFIATRVLLGDMLRTQLVDVANERSALLMLKLYLEKARPGLVHLEMKDAFLRLYQEYRKNPRPMIDSYDSEMFPGKTSLIAVFPYVRPSDVREPIVGIPARIDRFIQEKEKVLRGDTGTFMTHFQEMPNGTVTAFFHIAFETGLVRELNLREQMLHFIEPYLPEEYKRPNEAGLEEAAITPEIEQAAAARGWTLTEVAPNSKLYRTRQGGWVSPNAVLGIDPSAEISDGAWVRGATTRVEADTVISRSLVEDAVVLEGARVAGAVVRTVPALQDSWAWNSTFKVNRVTQTVIGKRVVVGRLADGEPAEILNAVIGDRTQILGGSIRNSEIGPDNLLVRSKVGLTHTEDHVTFKTKNGAPIEVSESWIGWGRTIDFESYNEHLSPNFIRRAYVDVDGSVKFETVEDIPAVVFQGYATVDASYDATGKIREELASSRHGKGGKLPGSIIGPVTNAILLVHPDFENSGDFLNANSLNMQSVQGQLTALHPFSYSHKAAKVLGQAEDRPVGEVWGQVIPGASRFGLNRQDVGWLWVFEHARPAIAEILTEMHRQVDLHADTAGWDAARRQSAHSKVENLPRYSLETGKALARLENDPVLEERYDRHLKNQGPEVERLTLADLLATEDPTQNDWADQSLFTEPNRKEMDDLPQGVELLNCKIGKGAKIIGARARLDGVEIPAGATVFVWNSYLTETALSDGNQLRSVNQHGGSLGKGVDLTNVRLKNSQLQDRVVGSGAVIDGSKVGSDSSLEPYARFINSTMGSDGMFGAIARFCRFARGLTCHHLARTRLENVITEESEVLISGPNGTRKVKVPDRTNISAGTVARGTPERPIRLQTTMLGANVSIPEGVTTGYLSFVKNVGQTVPPFAMSRGQGPDKITSGFTPPYLPSMVMRLLGKTLDLMPEADRAALNLLMDQQLAVAGLDDQRDGRWTIPLTGPIKSAADLGDPARGKWEFKPKFPGDEGYGANPSYVWVPKTAGLEEGLDRKDAIRQIEKFVQATPGAEVVGGGLVRSAQEILLPREMDALLDAARSGTGTGRFRTEIMPDGKRMRVSSNAEIEEPAAVTAEAPGVVAPSVNDLLLGKMQLGSVRTRVSKLGAIVGPHETGLAYGAALSAIGTVGEEPLPIVFIVMNDREAELVRKLAPAGTIFQVGTREGEYPTAEIAAQKAEEWLTRVKEVRVPNELKLGTDGQPVSSQIRNILKTVFGIELEPGSVTIWKNFIRDATLKFQA